MKKDNKYIGWDECLRMIYFNMLREDFFSSEEDYKDIKKIKSYRNDLKERLKYYQEASKELKTIIRYFRERRDFQKNQLNHWKFLDKYIFADTRIKGEVANCIREILIGNKDTFCIEEYARSKPLIMFYNWMNDKIIEIDKYLKKIEEELMDIETTYSHS